MQYDSFYEYMKNAESDNLNEIVEHGCVSGCTNGLIYYHETNEIYDRFCDELHEVLANDIENFGECPKYITDALAQGVMTFKNALVWYVAETYANQIINETEEA